MKKGIDEVRSQVDRAERTAHAENKRRFDEHEQRIKELFGDVQTVIAGLSENLVQHINLYGTAYVEGCSGEASHHKRRLKCDTNISPRRLMTHLLHQMVHHRTTLRGNGQ